MKRGTALLLAAAALSAAGRASVIGNAPYDAPGEPERRIPVRIDFSAARRILEALAAPKPRPGDAAALASLPAIHAQIADAGKTDEQWAADFAGAFSPESRIATFDLRTIREERERWEVLLSALESRKDRIEEQASHRAAAMLPGDGAIASFARVQASFALPGLADHLVSERNDGGIEVVIDLARALSASPGVSDDERAEGLARIASVEAFRSAWAAYRRQSPGWTIPSERLAGAEPLVRAAAAAGPVGLFAFDKSFFPLSDWMKDVMLRAMDAFNQESEDLLNSKTALPRRAEILAGINRNSFARDPALSAGAFLCDGIFQAGGKKALVDALAGGPESLVAAYLRASKSSKSLPPLAHAMAERFSRR